MKEFLNTLKVAYSKYENDFERLKKKETLFKNISTLYINSNFDLETIYLGEKSGVTSKKKLLFMNNSSKEFLDNFKDIYNLNNPYDFNESNYLIEKQISHTSVRGLIPLLISQNTEENRWDLCYIHLKYKRKSFFILFGFMSDSDFEEKVLNNFKKDNYIDVFDAYKEPYKYIDFNKNSYYKNLSKQIQNTPEYRRKRVNELLNRGLSKVNIAKYLHIEEKTVFNDIMLMTKKQRE